MLFLAFVLRYIYAVVPYYLVFNLLLKVSLLVITDSGGIQEEGCFLNKKVIVCRKVTERPEGISTGHIKLCRKPKDLNSIFELQKENFIINKDCPYGDGKSAQRIVKIINET